MKNYIILKNGNQMDFTPRDLNGAIRIIRQLESHINRLTEHSPYTIAKAHAPCEVNDRIKIY